MRKFKCFLSIILAFSFIFCINTTTYAASKKELQQKLQTIEQELNNLNQQNNEKSSSKDKLSTELKLIEEKYQTNISLIDSEKQQIKDCEKQIELSNEKVSEYEKDIEEKNKAIGITQKSYDEAKNNYYKRLRNMYVTGNYLNNFLILFEANGFQDLLNKAQTIEIYNNQSSYLLKKYTEEQKKLEEEKNELEEKNKELQEELVTLQEKKDELTNTQKELETSEKELKEQEITINDKKSSLETEIKSIADKTKEYGELREQTAEELAEIDRDIANADKQYPVSKPETTKPSATKPSSGGDKTNNSETTTHPTTKPSTNNKYINLTYPVPAYTRITCEYGGYAGHTGCDFSTFGNVNQRVVAADSGTVIISKDLTNSNGKYRSYGRYIVIRHDHPTESGQTVYTLYAHNNSRLVSAGEHVTRGQTIALSGSTGNSTGPHCHFEVRVGGSTQNFAVNPRFYL